MDNVFGVTASSEDVVDLIDTALDNAETAREAAPVFSPASAAPADFIKLKVGETRQIAVPTGTTPKVKDTNVCTVSFVGLGRIFRNWVVTGVATGHTVIYNIGVGVEPITVYVY